MKFDAHENHNVGPKSSQQLKRALWWVILTSFKPFVIIRNVSIVNFKFLPLPTQTSAIGCGLGHVVKSGAGVGWVRFCEISLASVVFYVLDITSVKKKVGSRPNLPLGWPPLFI